MNRTTKQDILRDVAKAIIDSGYAVRPGDEVPDRLRVASRAQARTVIANDDRLHSRSRYTQGALIDDVMYTYGVSRSNAKALISRARRREVR